MGFLVPAVVDEGMPESFANAAAYGDLIAGLLAIVALLMLLNKILGAITATWLASLFGTADLVFALGHVEAVPYMGGMWYVPTLLVPLLLVTHVMSVVRLLKKEER